MGSFDLPTRGNARRRRGRIPARTIPDFRAFPWRAVHGFALLLLLGLTTVAAGAAPFAALEVQSLHYFRTPTHSRLVFDTSAPVQAHKIYHQTHLKRVLIDVPGAVLTGLLPQAPANDPLVRGVRALPGPKGVLRLAVDLKAEATAVSHADSDGRRNHRLVIDLAGDTRTAAAASLPAAPVAKRSPPPLAAVPATPSQGNKPLARRKSPAVRAPAPLPPRRQGPVRGERNVVIAIDAGHGGDDPGAHGPHGTDEKAVTLAIARKLEKLVRKEPGMKAVMIRNGDHYLALRERIRKARKHKADLFVSLHADAFINDAARGSSVFTLSEHGASNEAARWLAEKENAAELVGGVSLDDKDDVLASVLLDLSQTATLEASHEIAGNILAELGRHGALHHRDVQRAGFVVLKAPDIPSVLVETAFISNPDEERKLRDPAQQETIARALFRGIRNYFALRALPGTRLAAP